MLARQALQQQHAAARVSHNASRNFDHARR
jgi:hypothetical protein